jgi:hypothetical protein
MPYNVAMRKTNKVRGADNGRRPKVSKLGRELREISDRYFASGGQPLSRREIEREVAERRGAR